MGGILKCSDRILMDKVKPLLVEKEKWTSEDNFKDLWMHSPKEIRGSQIICCKVDRGNQNNERGEDEENQVLEVYGVHRWRPWLWWCPTSMDPRFWAGNCCGSIFWRFRFLCLSIHSLLKVNVPWNLRGFRCFLNRHLWSLWVVPLTQ